MQPYIEFYNGQKMPIIGLGTWECSLPEDIENTIDEALKTGYRHIDTAYAYGNEKGIGKILKKWLDLGKIKREELFIVTKLPGIGMQKEKVQHFIDLSLKNLQLDYVDLYLVHNPVGINYKNDTECFPTIDGTIVDFDMKTNLEEIWKTMEIQVDNGKAKSIGISNFNSKQIDRIMNVARIPPTNLQVELHVYFQQKPLREVCKKHNITLCAYAPIGSPGRKIAYKKYGLEFEPPGLLEDPIVLEIAKNHSKTPAQILLRFIAQNGIAAIPKSTNTKRIQENYEIFDFELTEQEMKELEALDKGKDGRTFIYSDWRKYSDHPENFEAIPF